MNSSLRWIGLAVLLAFVSCERAIEFEPVTRDASLVVDGVIESDGYPVVYLSRSLSFFSKISPEELAGSFVRGATVRVSGGGKTQTLAEKEAFSAGGVAIYYYAVDSSNLAQAFKGEPGKTYTLEITTPDNKSYSSQTTIPLLAKTITRLYFEEYIDDDDSSKVALYGEFNDPPGLGNYIRYFTQTGDSAFYPGLNSVFDDQIVDGKEYSIQIEKGVDRNSEIDFEQYSFFHRGDSITVKFCNVDKGVYDFWRTMEYSYQSIGNPFSSPTKVQGNISNGALGYFGGYAVQYTTITIPE